MDYRKRILEIHRETISSEVTLFNQYYNRYPLVTDSLLPCHFTGDIEEIGKIVVISLNPKYTPECTEHEQNGCSLEEWYDFCRNRFKEYPCDISVNRTFKNLRKLLIVQDRWGEHTCRFDLQKALINIDWCPYYSRRFPTIYPERVPDDVKLMLDRWDKVLDELIGIAEPKLLFVHGKTMENWVTKRVELQEICDLENDRGNSSHVWEGQFMGVRLVYLEHGITVVGNNRALARLGRILGVAL